LQVSVQHPKRLKPVENKNIRKGFTAWNLRGIIYKEEELDELLNDGTKKLPLLEKLK